MEELNLTGILDLNHNNIWLAPEHYDGKYEAAGTYETKCGTSICQCRIFFDCFITNSGRIEDFMVRDYTGTNLNK